MTKPYLGSFLIKIRQKVKWFDTLSSAKAVLKLVYDVSIFGANRIHFTGQYYILRLVWEACTSYFIVTPSHLPYLLVTKVLLRITNHGF
jgi:hypothetical protein